MMTSRTFTRDNGDIVEVDFAYRILGSSELEVTEYSAWLVKDANDTDAPTLRLTDDEWERFELGTLYPDPDIWDVGSDW